MRAAWALLALGCLCKVRAAFPTALLVDLDALLLLGREGGDVAKKIRRLEQQADRSEAESAALPALYADLYADMDVSSLLPRQDGSDQGDFTGFSHRVAWRRLLYGSPAAMFVASNGPISHINRVLAALGLCSLTWDGIFCPETRGGLLKENAAFYQPLLTQGDAAYVGLEGVSFQVARACGLRCIRLGGDGLGVALAKFRGTINCGEGVDDWKLSEVSYLAGKNAVDALSRSAKVWKALEKEVASLDIVGGEFRVVDVGAGLLPLLPPVVSLPGQFTSISYTAYETCQEVSDRSADMLLEMGYQEQASTHSGAIRYLTKREHGRDVQVKLVQGSFLDDHLPVDARADLIIGCCLADLYDPARLVPTLIGLAGGPTPLIYLPITFVGSTEFNAMEQRSGHIPSDAEVLDAYDESLVSDQGHHTDVDLLIAELQSYGCFVLETEPSDWNVAADTSPYFWECLMYFVGVGISSYLPNDDLKAWRERTLLRRPSFRIRNVDILARATSLRGGASGSIVRGSFLEFHGERKLSMQKEVFDILNIPDGSILIKTETSCISSGTELKIFRGQIEPNVQLDTTIEGMDKDMEYPMRYGYSLVGRVVACGPGIKADKYMGKRMFAFSPHASHALVPATSAMIVPEGISADDAAFLPAVETALSLVQDAGALVGERIAVYGQGIIGVLVVSILSRSHSGIAGGSVTGIDPLAARRNASLRAGACQALSPQDLPSVPRFDVSIEVSGNPAGLQSALDRTMPGGCVVIGSWYSDVASLSLGAPFHRGRIRLKTSQVSFVPAALCDRWDKARRFAATWALLRELRPARLLRAQCMSHHKAQAAYELLDRGERLCILLKY